MVVSMRHFLRFIDLDKTFDDHGFFKKTGAAFKLNNKKEAYTDFVVNAGPDSYAWNVIRSESDDLIFRHAGKCGAHIFDGVKVESINFVPLEGKDAYMNEDPNPGRPISATWSKKDGSTGEISFEYLIDASGRAGIVSTKYLKNRSFNQDLKNVASWGYFRGAIMYGVGTPKENQPYFEALDDGSGWAWFIPLHNGTVSVGVVMNQQMSTAKKREAELSGKDFYLASVKEAKGISHLLSEAVLDSDIKHASDWSYNASQYASPYVRIVGDAGAFIDPYFSSGCHLAFSGALAAATTICGSIKGQAPERAAWKWHSKLVHDRYTRFLLVVLSATKQIRHKDAPVLNSEGDEGFDDAFNIIRPGKFNFFCTMISSHSFYSYSRYWRCWKII
jgi:flavine halogenase